MWTRATEACRRRSPAIAPLHPFTLAFLLSLLYVVLSGSYIVFSGIIAAGLSETVHQLERLETAKGLVFVLATGALFFGLAWTCCAGSRGRRSA